MKRQWPNGIAVGAALAAASLITASCMNNPSTFNKRGVGSLEVWASVTKPQDQSVLGKAARDMATTWDSLVVKITASDMDTLLSVTKFGPQDPYITVTLDDVPAGKQRHVEVFTKTKNDIIINVSAHQTIDISSAEKKVLDFALVPQYGSIYIDLTNIPTTVKQVCASFGGLSACDNRAAKLYLSIDYIPDRTSDSLIIQGTDTSGNLVYRSSLWLAFSSLRDTTVTTLFCRVSTNVSLAVTAQVPASTVVSGNIGSAKTAVRETGRLIISEIMYNANDSEYVEIYNPSDSGYADSLILEIDGICRPIGLVAIQAKGFFVVGRRSLPWSDAWPSSSSALDLSSSGNWISLRVKAGTDTVMDWVAFCGGNNSQEWPNLGTAKKSIILDSCTADPLYNNYGRNWTTTQTVISQSYPSVSTAQCGTPKIKGI